mmetsp:Transcript_4530/g.8847  ORF Transcript_4530/g.8847 Transcript_4530/m.8847 type:complete len:133 (-) Transcript_4530:214-612(-)
MARPEGWEGQSIPGKEFFSIMSRIFPVPPVSSRVSIMEGILRRQRVVKEHVWKLFMAMQHGSMANSTAKSGMRTGHGRTKPLLTLSFPRWRMLLRKKATEQSATKRVVGGKQKRGMMFLETADMHFHIDDCV